MIDSKTFPGLDKPSLCFQCGGIFVSKASLKTHVEIDHEKNNARETESIFDSPKEKDVIEDQCNEEFPYSQNKEEENENCKNIKVHSIKGTAPNMFLNTAKSEEMVSESLDNQNSTENPTVQLDKENSKISYPEESIKIVLKNNMEKTRWILGLHCC